MDTQARSLKEPSYPAAEESSESQEGFQTQRGGCLTPAYDRESIVPSGLAWEILKLHTFLPL